MPAVYALLGISEEALYHAQMQLVRRGELSLDDVEHETAEEMKHALRGFSFAQLTRVQPRELHARLSSATAAELIRNEKAERKITKRAAVNAQGYRGSVARDDRGVWRIVDPIGNTHRGAVMPSSWKIENH